MILLQGNNIARTFGADILFENINFTIQDNSRVSLVGRNGAGKSTLLKIIAGVESASRGEVSKTKNLSMSYLAQEQALARRFQQRLIGEQQQRSRLQSNQPHHGS